MFFHLAQTTRIIKGLIAGSVAVGMASLSAIVWNQPGIHNSVPLTYYSNSAEGYEVNFPSSWHTGDLDHGKISRTKDGIFIGSLTISTKVKTNKKFDDFVEQDLKARVNRAGSKYQSFDKIVENRVARQGKAAYYLEIVTKQENAVHADHTAILYVDRGNGRLIGLVMGVNEDEWEKNPESYRRSIMSLKLKS